MAWMLVSNEAGGALLSTEEPFQRRVHIWIRTDVYAKYDYGSHQANMEHYGSPKPPLYNGDEKLVLGGGGRRYHERETTGRLPFIGQLARTGPLQQPVVSLLAGRMWRALQT